ncbi:hypothetical protein [Streptomyces roseoverticillatus]|uniref:Uncharacterized protein n=1 Tax=Streptomyces roseoverticillatus TaxID=66429 RepID=A0ABV3IXK9_9ACTN
MQVENCSLVPRRRKYLAANRQTIEAGGKIHCLFIAYRDHLADKTHARGLLALIASHRQLGVTCGLAVHEHLHPEQAVDYILFAAAAVLVEEDRRTPTTPAAAAWIRGVAGPAPPPVAKVCPLPSGPTAPSAIRTAPRPRGNDLSTPGSIPATTHIQIV